MPGYWMDETSGVLRPAVEAYLCNEDMTPAHWAAIRAYLAQWMQGPWRGESVPQLRAGIASVSSRESFEKWLDIALGEGIDPL